MLNKYTILAFIISLLLLFVVLGLMSKSGSGDDLPHTSKGLGLTVEIFNFLSIGDDKSKPIEYSFGSIENVVADSLGNMYVLDSSVQKIRKYNKEGLYMFSIGQRGRGPGEFISLSFIFIRDGFLYAADPLQFRISKFDLDGELLDSYLTPKHSQVLNFFQQVVPYGEDFLVYYKQWGAGEWAEYNKDEILHIWPENFENEFQAFGSFDEFGYANKDMFAKLITRSRGGSILHLDDQIIVAPYVYNGTLSLYEKENNVWISREAIKGRETKIPAYITLDKRNGDVDAAMTRSFEGEFYGKVNIKDAGLYTYDGKYILHFLLTKLYKNRKESTKNISEINWELGVEIFDMNLNYLEYHSLDTFPYAGTNKKRLVNFKDENGRFYMISTRDGLDVVDVFKLNITEK